MSKQLWSLKTFAAIGLVALLAVCWIVPIESIREVSNAEASELYGGQTDWDTCGTWIPLECSGPHDDCRLQPGWRKNEGGTILNKMPEGPIVYCATVQTNICGWVRSYQDCNGTAPFPPTIIVEPEGG